MYALQFAVSCHIADTYLLIHMLFNCNFESLLTFSQGALK